MDTPILQGPTRKWEVDLAITPLRFCQWLSRYIERWPTRGEPPFFVSDDDELNHYELLPYLDNLQGPAPHVVVVKRTIIHEMDEIAGSYENGRESMIVLSVSISPIQRGSRLVIETPETWKTLLEMILLDLDELPNIVQDLSGMNDQTRTVQGRGKEAAAAQGEQLQTRPSVPRRQADFDRWCETWRAISGEVKRGNKTLKNLDTFLGRYDHTKELRCSDPTMRKIIKAGEAGLLDTPERS